MLLNIFCWLLLYVIIHALYIDIFFNVKNYQHLKVLILGGGMGNENQNVCMNR